MEDQKSISVFSRMNPPLDARSAGLLDEFTNLHFVTSETFRISATMSATKHLNLEVSFQLYLSTKVLSVQKQNPEIAC